MRLWAILLLAAFWFLLAFVVIEGANGHPRPFPRAWLRDALCVHRFEGSWTDPGAPHYGGMQFTWSTWLRNGGAKYALYPHQATPHEQLHVARATFLREGGWRPWATTARMCGLL